MQVGGAIGNYTEGLKIDRFEPNRVASIMFTGCANFTLLIALFRTSFAAVGTLVFLLGYGLMSANAGCFALGAAHSPTPIRATGVGWVLGIGRIAAILGAGSGAIIMSWGWSITDIFMLLTVPVLTAAIATYCKRCIHANTLASVSHSRSAVQTYSPAVRLFSTKRASGLSADGTTYIHCVVTERSQIHAKTVVLAHFRAEFRLGPGNVKTRRA